MSALSITRLSETVSSTGEHVACLHCLLLPSSETVSATGEHGA
jgi:hypothetical protein